MIMKTIFLSLFLFFAIGITGTKCQETNLTTYDSEFYVGFYEHVHTAQTHQLYIHTYKTSAVSFSVTSLDGVFSYTGTCTHLNPAVVNIPFSYEVRGYDYSWRRKGLRISSLETEPISVMAWSYRSEADFMAYLAYPCHKQPTTEYIYYAVSSSGWNDQKSQFLIVGCHNNTNVTVIPKGTVTLPTDAQDTNSGTVTLTAGQSHSLVLHSMQTLIIFVSFVDLTASKILSNNLLTVISGHEASRVPAGTFDADPIVTQVPPTIQWGKKFLLSPHSGRTGQNYRMIASMDNTIIVRKCGSDALVNSTLHADQWSEFYTTGTIYCSVVSNQPIYVAQLGVSTYYSGGSYGDPSINTVAPIEQYINSIQYTAFTATYHYYSVVIPSDEYYNGTILFDGSLQTISGWTTIYYSDGSIAGYGYSASTTGSHTIAHPNDEGKLFVSVYGWTTNGGYSYAAGMSVKPLITNYTIPEITFTSSEFIVTEVNGTIYVYLERLKVFDGDVSVKFFVSPIPVDTAIDGQDYISSSKIVNFTSGGSTTKAIPLQIIDDECFEPTEYFTIKIEPLDGDVTFPLNVAIVAIEDDDDEDCNECEVNNGGCEQNCINTVGSHYCTCNDSYKLNFDSKTCQPNCSNPCGNCISCLSVDLCECFDGWTADNCCTDINECETDNGGCQQNCHNRDGSFYCSCNSGYIISDNHLDCDDIDECATGIDGCNHNCSNTNGSYACFCYAGYELHDNMKTCIDTNECEDDNGGCDHTCINIGGSYQCACNDGYKLDSDFHSCIDIDECSEITDLCEHNCYNTNGSYICDCKPGYMIGDEGFFCSDINECLTNNGGCNQMCTNEVGSYHCDCQEGLELHDDLHDCLDINECDSNNGGCEHICTNTISSFYCLCYNGYQLSSNQFCSDINECLEGTDGCDQICSNTLGAYYCACSDGFTLDTDNHTCHEIDECTEEISGCSQSCVNTAGSYYCSCDFGFEIDADQHTCHDTNECDSNNGGCEYNCINTVGSYYCSCDLGYSLSSNEISCNDINECAVYNGRCDHTCTNTIGSYVCSCDSGYILNSNNHNCSDIDECHTVNGGCEQNCVNIDGSYSCTCESGYMLDNNDRNCSDINECETDNGGCEHICTNTQSSFYCSCRNGYELLHHLFCSDINECETNECDQDCVNTLGSYYCTCREGFSLSLDNYTCNDIDECKLNAVRCEQECYNTEGSYFCECNDGYDMESNGYNCTITEPVRLEKITGSNINNSNSSTSYIIPIIIIIIIVIILVVVLAITIMIMRRKIKKLQGNTETSELTQNQTYLEMENVENEENG